MRVAPPVVIDDSQRDLLKQWARSRSLSARQVERAKVVLLAADGKTDLDAVVVRDGKNLKGRMLGFVLRIFGGRVLGNELAKTVKAIEARNA